MISGYMALNDGFFYIYFLRGCRGGGEGELVRVRGWGGAIVTEEESSQNLKR